MQETQTPTLAPARRAKFWIGGAIIVAVLAGLILWAMTQPGAASNYISPSDLTAGTATTGTDPLRLAGTVVPGSIEHEGLTTTFSVADETNEVRVTTDSPLPDAFKDSSEVVATGIYDGTRFIAGNVLAKCPSKFKAKV